MRDRAIVLPLVRLGLRGGDIASMRPGDIDWKDATLLVRGKGRRDVRLPLPQDAGDAVLDYIEQARPQVAIDRVFLCSKAPSVHSDPESSSLESFAARCDIRKVALWLGHASLQSTEVYVRADPSREA